MNKECYYFKSILFKHGILNNIIDAVYVLLLEGSTREKKVYDQLNKYKLCSINHIQYNKGLKCEKNLINKTTNYDIMNANINIFKHAKYNNYKNILVLEDDFIFDNRIKSNKNIKSISNFINNNDVDIYYLSLFPILNKPIINNFKHMHVIFSVSTHSVIYSENIRNKVITIYSNTKKLGDTYKHFDLSINSLSKKKYCYYKPLCYQIFKNTKNKKTWENNFINFILLFLKLNKKPQPGFDLLYILNYYIQYLFLIFIIYIIYKLFTPLKF